MAHRVRKFCPVCGEWREVISASRDEPEEKRCKKHGKPWKGTTTKTVAGYVRRRRGYGQPLEYEHRIVWEDAHGPIPTGYHVHHKNHVRDDNRLENLELVLGSRHNAKHTSERHLAGLMPRDVERKNWRTDIDDAYISRRYQEGASLRQIGREVDATHNVIAAHLQRLGLR